MQRSVGYEYWRLMAGQLQTPAEVSLLVAADGPIEPHYFLEQRAANSKDSGAGER